MSDKTKVVVKSKDGSREPLVLYFDSYGEATAWITRETGKADVTLGLKHADFSQEPTIEIYEEES